MRTVFNALVFFLFVLFATAAGVEGIGMVISGAVDTAAVRDYAILFGVIYIVIDRVYRGRTND